MKYKLLGKSGLRVSELCLGTMTFGEDWGWGASKDESRAVFEAFAAAGGTLIDTANMYTNGSSETITGELISSDRDRYVLATKYTFPDNPTSPANAGNPNAAGNQRKNLMRSVEGSLKRLGTDYIDLLWLHAWDFMTPVDEVMRGLDDLVSAGKIGYIGISDAPAWVVSQANTLAEWRGWTPFVALQIEYSLIERTPERDLLPMAKAFGLTVTPWSPLGQGVLTGKYNGDAKKRARGWVATARRPSPSASCPSPKRWWTWPERSAERRPRSPSRGCWRGGRTSSRSSARAARTRSRTTSPAWT